MIILSTSLPCVCMKSFLNGDDDSRTFVDDDKLFVLQVI
jgi:hypothetical protein